MSPNSSATRLAYKPEELLALRGSANESHVSLEKFPDEEVIKEHVIKKTPSGDYDATVENVRPAFPPLGPVSGNNMMDLTIRPRQPYAVPIGGSAVKRPSPTPSVKRSKAEQLLKQHGSPPHVRVTAGGRIVPSDLPQLGSPRLPFTPVFNSRVPSRTPHALAGGVPNASQLPNGFLGYNPYGKLIQWFDGRWHEVRTDAYGQPMYQISPPNMPFPSASAAFGYVGPQMNTHAGYIPHQPYNESPAFSNAVVNAVPDDIDNQIAVSKAEYDRVRLEKIDLERHEVKASEQMSAAQRAQIVGEKRKYVLMLDTIRKKIKELETLKNGDASTSLSNGDGLGTNSNGGTGISTLPTPVYNMGGIDGANGAGPAQVWSLQSPTGSSGLPAGNFNGVSWSHYQPAKVANAAQGGASITGRQQQPEHTMESPASDPSPSSRAQPRRSHAVQIRDPNEHVKDHTSNKHSLSVTGEHHPSNLNPASPSYEPGKPYPLTEGSPPHFVVPAPTPIETPNPPPAELAKHWVFSQQIQSHELLQEHGHMVMTRDWKKDGITASSQAQNGHSEMQIHGRVDINRSSNEGNIEHSSHHPTSHSSVTTTDFFPVNTHEHSFNKYMSRKTSAAARLSMEGNPCTPMRDPHSGIVSPMTDYLHPPVPPVSPASHYGVPPHLLANSPEDMRLSSFLRDTSRAAEQLSDEQVPQHSPVRAETRDEFHGKSKAYLEGYIAGSSGHAPTDPKNQDYCAGYIDGLSKMCLGGTSVTRESSTISLKSQTISVSRTPPNTTDNRSLIADLAGAQPNRGENVRLTQSLNFSSPPSGGNHPGNDTVCYGGDSHTSSTAYLADNTKSHHPSGYNLTSQAHLPRSWSEDNSGSTVSQSKGAFYPSSGPWNVPTHQPKIVTHELPTAHSQAAVTAGSYSVDRRSNRMVSTSVSSQQPLTGYSGNQPGARVGSIPQHSVFGDDKYVVTTTTIEASKTATSRYPLHENQPSISTTVSRGSQYDGAMDDLAEMKEVVPPMAMQDTTQHREPASTHRTGYPMSSSTPHAGTAKMPSHNASVSAATPPASPSKGSNISPKKVTSPRHRMQQLRDKVGDFLDRGSHCGGAERSGEHSRAESPDPKHMSPEEKKRWKDGWRSKLSAAKAREDIEVRKWRREKGQSQSGQAQVQ